MPVSTCLCYSTYHSILILGLNACSHCCQSLVELTALLRAELEPNLLLSALYGVLRLEPDLWRDPRGPEPDGVRVLLLVGIGIEELLGCLVLAENGVLSWELALSVLSRPPGVEVFRGTPDPNPMGLGLRVLEPDLMLDVLLTPEPRLPSSSELRDMLEP